MLAVLVACFTLCGVCTYVGPVCFVCLFVVDSPCLVLRAHSEYLCFVSLSDACSIFYPTSVLMHSLVGYLK